MSSEDVEEAPQVAALPSKKRKRPSEATKNGDSPNGKARSPGPEAISTNENTTTEVVSLSGNEWPGSLTRQAKIVKPLVDNLTDSLKERVLRTAQFSTHSRFDGLVDYVYDVRLSICNMCLD